MSLFRRSLKALGFDHEPSADDAPKAGGHEQPQTAIPDEDRKELIASVTGLPVRRPEIYERALRHASLVRHRPDRELKSNERLEFLGDAVLGLAAAEFLYAEFPEKDEGFLTRIRAKLVNKQALAGYAETIKIRPLISMSDDMVRQGGRMNPSLLANAFEALLGAIYLDHGFDAARRFVLDTISQSVNLDEVAERRENFKSLLLEFAQARGWPQPQYHVVSEEGPGHSRTFKVEVTIGEDAHGIGEGKSKKVAEQRAAATALTHLEAGQRALSA